MSDAGLLDAAFRLSALAAGAGAAVCLVLAARSPALTRELIWTLVPPALLAALLLIGRA